MKERVLFVSPPFYKPYQRGGEQVQADSAPLGLGYVAAYILREAPQVEVRLIDYGIEIYSPEIWRRELVNFKPDIVGLSVLTLGYNQAMGMAKIVREYSPGVLIVAGGPHATVYPEQCLDNCDIVVRGEGEKTFLEIIQDCTKEAISGISYRRNEKIVHNPEAARIQDLDGLPFTAHHLFQLAKYKQFPGAGIIGSRGCAYSCIFCASVRLWGRVIRFRSPKNLVDEIEYLYNNFSIRHIIFQDDAINLTQERAFEVCNEIISRGLHRKMSFEAQARANRACVSLELFQKLKEANFNDITFGVESGSDKVLKSLKKSLTVKEARQAIKLARQAGIKTVTGFFMVGNWGETIWDVFKTWWFVYTNQIDMTLTVCTPLPGTEFYTVLEQNGYLSDKIDWQNVNWVTPLNRTDKLSKQAIRWLYYATVLFVHLPTSLLRGGPDRAKALSGNIIRYAWNLLRPKRGKK